MRDLIKVGDTINANETMTSLQIAELWEFEKALKYLSIDRNKAISIYENALVHIKDTTIYFLFYQIIHHIGIIIYYIPKENYDQKTYLIIDNISGLIKIGKSKNPTDRFTQLCCSNVNMVLYAICNNDCELKLHQKYKHKKIDREWYELDSSDIINIIKEYEFRIV